MLYQIESSCDKNSCGIRNKSTHSNYGQRGDSIPKNFQNWYLCGLPIGYGGHARQILEELSLNGKLIGIDKDEEAIKFAKKVSAFSNVQLFHNSYHKIKDILSISKTQKVDGMLLDLGLSSAQLDSKSRGFSYKINSELDMRFDLSQKYKANDLLNIKSKKEIADIIFKYSDERRSRAIADSILKMRPIKNVYELVEAIKRSTPPKNRTKL